MTEIQQQPFYGKYNRNVLMLLCVEKTDKM